MSCCESHEHDEDIFVGTIQVGKKVPNLTFDAFSPEEGEFTEVSFEEIQKAKKWTVLFFYPADFTFVCPTELADLADCHEKLKSLGVEVISMSCDTKFAHLAWRHSEPLLSNVKYLMGEDPNGRISNLFGIYDEETGKAMRGTIIINPEGIFQGIEVSFDNVGRNAAELVRKMEAHVYLRKHPNEVCPARWEKGAKTLTPSEKIVGKVGDALK